jgi:hypothetical protein
MLATPAFHPSLLPSGGIDAPVQRKDMIKYAEIRGIKTSFLVLNVLFILFYFISVIMDFLNGHGYDLIIYI